MELLRMADQLDTLYDRFAQEDGLDLQYVVHTHHFELHMRIAEYARCPELKEAIEKNQVLIYNWFFDLAAQRRRLPLGFHSRLLKAVTGSDPLAADKAMRLHVQYGLSETLRQVIPQNTNDWRLPRSAVQGNGRTPSRGSAGSLGTLAGALVSPEHNSGIHRVSRRKRHSPASDRIVKWRRS